MPPTRSRRQIKPWTMRKLIPQSSLAAVQLCLSVVAKARRLTLPLTYLRWVRGARSISLSRILASRCGTRILRVIHGRDALATSGVSSDQTNSAIRFAPTNRHNAGPSGGRQALALSLTKPTNWIALQTPFRAIQKPDLFAPGQRKSKRG